MNFRITRRTFGIAAAGCVSAGALAAQEQDSVPAQEGPKPYEAEFTRDYEPPKFKLKWDKPQINREMATDFILFAHSDLKMVKKLLDKEPALLNAAMDWGKGDWETALGGASHMGRKDIAKFLLSRGARVDIFAATMLGMLDSVKEMLTFEPKLIDLRGPHGFDLHWHAQVGQDEAKPVLDYLQSIKKKKLRNIPFLKKKKVEGSKKVGSESK